MLIKEVRCKSLLNKSGLADYCINCYTGCSHGCRYCYARFMKKYTGHTEPWGKFVDVKVNAPDVLSREIAKRPRGSVFMSSVCDPYMTLEKKYELTRKCLEILLKRQWPVIVQTKSPLVLRDLNILRQFNDVTVGFTITTLDKKVREAFEPAAPQTEDRIRALKTIHDAGIKTYAFLGPMYPLLIDKEVEELFKRLADIPVDEVYVDRLNIKSGNWGDTRKALEEHHPELLEQWKTILFQDSDYYQMLKERISELSKKYNLGVVYCY